MRKKICLIITFLIILIPFYVSAEEAGSLNISCNPSTVKSGETTNCIVTGNTNKEITVVHANIQLSENLELIEFNASDNWHFKDIDNGKIDFVTDSGDPITSEFTVGTLKLKAKNGVFDKDETVSLTSNTFYYDWTDYQIPDATAAIRIPSTNNSLSSIKVNGDGKFFDENKTNFDLTVKSETANIVVTTKDSKAKVKGNGQIKLNYGKNTHVIEVTAEDGSKKTYTLNISRPDSRSNENYLLDFGFVNHDIKFDKNKTEYELTVENNISKIGYFYTFLSGDVKIPDMFSNVLFIDKSGIDASDHADINITLNDIDLDKRLDEILDYLRDVDSSSYDEEKCNDDKTECSYYRNGELVYKDIDKESFSSETGYKDEIPIYYFYEVLRKDLELFVLEDLKVGTNSLKVKVIAENGNERTYTFNINRKNADGKVVDNDIMPPQTGNTIYIIAVIMLVLSFGVGIYFYTKKIKNTI